MNRRPGTLAALAVLAIALPGAAAGCGRHSADGAPAGNGRPTGTVTVFAAASLTEPLTELGSRFETENPGTRIVLSFAASSALARQIDQGAPADVLATADQRTMATVTGAGNTDGDATVFARNQLVIAVPEGNPRHITGLAGLTAAGLKVAVCAPQVPCGAAARKALDTARVRLTPVTQEQDVKAALTKVTLGEVDAALVYRTDVRGKAAGAVDGIEFPESAQAVNAYPIAVLRRAPNKVAARAFLDYVLSATGRRVLSQAGFQTP